MSASEAKPATEIARDAAILRDVLQRAAVSAAAQAEHARGLAMELRAAAGIADPALLRSTAKLFGVAADCSETEIPRELARLLLAQFAWSEEPSLALRWASAKRQAIWKEQGIAPAGIDSVIVAAMQRAGQTTNQDLRELIRKGLQSSLSGSWAASTVAVAVSDILSGAPAPKRNSMNGTNFIEGFSSAAIVRMLGGRFRAGLRPLTDAVVEGRIRGLAGVFGQCRGEAEQSATARTVEDLMQRDVLVLATEGAAMACAKAGLLLPEAAAKAGAGLREVCEAVGMPPVLHMGDDLGNARILLAAAAVLQAAGWEDFPDLPLATATWSASAEEAIASALGFAATGMYVVAGGPFEAQLSDSLKRALGDELAETAGGRIECAMDPVAAAGKMLARIDRQRETLRINVKRERKLFDMKSRREL